MKNYLMDASPKSFSLTAVLGCFGRGIWLALVIFFAQNAWASIYENEIRAGIIYAGFSLLLFFGGIISALVRRFNL